MLFRLTYFFFLYGVVDAMLLCCVFSFFRSLVLLQVATLYCSWYGWWSDVLLLACLPACSFSCLSLYMSVCISFWFAVGLNDWLIEQNNPTFSCWELTLKQFVLTTNHEILYKRETRPSHTLWSVGPFSSHFSAMRYRPPPWEQSRLGNYSTLKLQHPDVTSHGVVSLSTGAFSQHGLELSMLVKRTFSESLSH